MSKMMLQVFPGMRLRDRDPRMAPRTVLVIERVSARRVRVAVVVAARQASATVGRESYITPVAARWEVVP